jgi:hypothetical protein
MLAARRSPPFALAATLQSLPPRAGDGCGPRPQQPAARSVFQMVGPDARGILADITQLLMHNGCEVRGGTGRRCWGRWHGGALAAPAAARAAALSKGALSQPQQGSAAPVGRIPAFEISTTVVTTRGRTLKSAPIHAPACRLPLPNNFLFARQVRSAALWTFRSRVACVIGATESGGRPVADSPKLSRLRAILEGLLAPPGRGESAVVEIEQSVVGAVHHERRLHQVGGSPSEARRFWRAPEPDRGSGRRARALCRSWGLRRLGGCDDTCTP